MSDSKPTISDDVQTIKNAIKPLTMNRIKAFHSMPADKWPPNRTAINVPHEVIVCPEPGTGRIYVEGTLSERTTKADVEDSLPDNWKIPRRGAEYRFTRDNETDYFYCVRTDCV